LIYAIFITGTFKPCCGNSIHPGESISIFGFFYQLKLSDMKMPVANPPAGSFYLQYFIAKSNQ